VLGALITVLVLLAGLVVVLWKAIAGLANPDSVLAPGMMLLQSLASSSTARPWSAQLCKDVHIASMAKPKSERKL
jgi:hypothetical protein